MDTLPDDTVPLLSLPLALIVTEPLQTALEHITSLVERLFGVPFAAVSLIDQDEQRFIAPRGFEPERIRCADSFCIHTIANGRMTIVADACSDDRFCHSPLVTGRPGIRFYAGVPLKTSHGRVLGTLCIMDTLPHRVLPDTEQALLTDLAAIVLDEIVLAQEGMRCGADGQRAPAVLPYVDWQPGSLVQYTSEIITLLDAEGCIRYESPSVERILGYCPGGRIGRSLFDFVHADDGAHVREHVAALLQAPGSIISIEFRLLHADGSWVYLEVVGNNLLADPLVGYVVMNARDITQRRQEQERLLLLESVVQQTSEAIVITDAHLEAPGPHIVFVNRGFELMMGYTAAEVLGRNPRMLRGPKSDSATAHRLRVALERHEPFLGETTNYRKDGSEVVVEWSVSPVHDANGKVSHYVSVQRDINIRKREEQIEAGRRLILQMVAENQPLPRTLTQLIHLIEEQHPEVWCEIFLLWDRQIAAPIAPDMLPACINNVQDQHDSVLCACIAEAWEKDLPVVTNDPHNDTRCARCCARQIAAPAKTCWSVPLVSISGEILGAFVVHYRELPNLMTDIEDLMATVSRLAVVAIEQRRMMNRLEYHAYHDALTRLPNRLLFEKRLQQSLTEADTYGWLVALLFIDLDRFKQVNDSLGHQIGDHLLEQVAARLQQSISMLDTMARLGGDEFALIMPQIYDPQIPMDMAQKILLTLQEPFFVAEHQLFLTANIGISLYPYDGADATALQRNADIAMYRTKRRGVSGYQYFSSEMHPGLARSLLELVEIEEHLHNASIFSQLRLHYQPQVELIHGKIVGVEALLRWEHPELGLIPPAKFIPVMERTGLIRPVGVWVLQQVCQQIAAWRESGYPNLFVAVNVSAEQFAQHDFVQTVEQVLHEHNLPPSCLELELTESLMFSDFEMTTRHLMELKRLGVSIAIDDFGTGHAVFANLQRLPIDNLKIDRSFIQDLMLPNEQSEQAAALIHTMVTLAQRLKMSTVIEGIETQQQSDVARRLGSERAQGYWFGRPMPASDFEQLLQQMDTTVPLDRAEEEEDAGDCSHPVI